MLRQRLSAVLAATGAATLTTAGIASIALAGAHDARTTARAAQASCSLAFTATPRVGPHAAPLAGTLTIVRGAGGVLTGSLEMKSGKAIPYRGQLNGLSISLLLAIPKQGIVFGTGMLAEPISKGHCGMTAGGTFSGPREGNIGDWSASQSLTAVGCPPGAFRPGPIGGGAGISREPTYGCLPLYFYATS